jgi:hypothetical protein
MKCPHCGFDNAYSKEFCANCKRNMTKVIDSRHNRPGAETAGRLAAELNMPKLTAEPGDGRLAVFLSVVTIVLLLSSLSVTWYHVSADTTSCDLGVFVGKTGRIVFDYSSYSEQSNLMSATGVGIAVATLLLLVLVASCLLSLRLTSVLISGAILLTILIVEFRFVLRIEDAIRESLETIVNWDHVNSYGLGIGWYITVIASAIQAVVLGLLALDMYNHRLQEAELYGPPSPKSK